MQTGRLRAFKTNPSRPAQACLMRTISLAFVIATLSGSAHLLLAERPSVPVYDLSIRLVPQKHEMLVRGTLALSTTTERRDVVDLLLSDLMADVKFELLSPRRTVIVDREEGPSVGAWRSNIWHLRFSRSIPPAAAVQVRFSYRCATAQTGFVFYVGPEVSFAAGVSTAWYPQLRVLEEGEESTLRVIGAMRFEVPPGNRVIASGQSRSTVEEERRGLFRFVCNQPVSLSFAAGTFTVHGPSGMESTAVYLLRDRTNVGEYTKGVERTVAVLERQFGPNPYKSFALVEVPDEIAGNAGFNGASQEGFILTSSSSLDAPFNPDHYGHEISHQWWGNLVRHRGASGRYVIDEAMAQYGALIAVNELAGPAKATRARFMGDPSSPSDQGVLAYLAMSMAGLDHPLSNLAAEWISSNIARSKGAIVFEMLASEIGEEAFRRALHRITHEFAFRRISWAEFRQVIAAESPGDIGWFFEQWFDAVGAPEWKLTFQQKDGDLQVVIHQAPPSFRATSEMVLTFDDGRTSTHRVKIEGEHTEFATTVPRRVVSVNLDPEFKIVHASPEMTQEAKALAAYWKALSMWQGGQAREAADLLQKAIVERKVPDTYAVQFMLYEALARVLQGEKELAPEAKRKRMEEALRRSLEAPTRRADRLPWVFYFLATVLKQQSQPDALREAVNGAISAEAALGEPTGWAAAARALLEH